MRRYKQIGFGLGVAAIVAVGFLATSGQYVRGPILPPCDSPGERLEWDGDSWECRRLNDYRGGSLSWSNDFINSSPTEWDVSATAGTGAFAGNVLTVNTNITRPGLLWLQTSTTTTGRATRRTQYGYNNGGLITSAAYTSVWSVGHQSNSTERYAALTGFAASDSSINPTDGCYFLYDEGNVATDGCNSGNAHKLQAFAVSGSTRTRVLLDGTSQDGACGAGAITTCDTTVAAVSGNSTGWRTLKVVMNGTDSCEFYVNDQLCTTLTTNIPTATTATGAMTSIVKSAGTTDRALYLDTHSLELRLTEPRT